MQAKNGDIWGAREALSELNKKELPPKVAYWLAKLARKVGEHGRDIETVRNKLILQYGSPGENGAIAINPGCAQWEAFATAYNELMNETVELEGLPMERITLPEDDPAIPPEKRLRISPEVLMALESFVNVAES